MENKKIARIKNVISSVFEILESDINDDSSPDTIGSWDSLKHMNLIIALEEEFEVTFTDNEIFEMMNYTSIKSIITGK